MQTVKEAIARLKTLSLIDGIRKIIYFSLKEFDLINLARKVRFYFFTRCWVKNITGKVFFETVALNVKIGKNATLYPNTVFEVGQSSQLIIGNSFTLSYGGIISCRHSVRIGNHVMVGEYCSIRDSTHLYNNLPIPFSEQGDKSDEIIIGNNVWIGRGTIILPGTIIGNDVIIGAHSVVKGSLKEKSMYGGFPLKLIKELTNIQNKTSFKNQDGILE
jgi:acetyltransferase-like isoleucine patch superfamily enzyme